MHRTVGVFAALIALALAGCSKPIPDSARPPGSFAPNGSAYLTDRGLFEPPLAKQLPSLDPTKIRAMQQRNADDIDADVQACMTAHGFKAPPGPKMPPEPASEKVDGYGIGSGYKSSLLFMSAPPTTTTPPATVEPLPPDAQKALTGDDGTGGCVAESRKKHPIADPTPALTALKGDLATLDRDIQSDPRNRAYEKEWVQCMGTRGFTVAARSDPRNMVTDQYAPIVKDNVVGVDEQAAFDAAFQFEKDIADADATCFVESGGESTAQQVIVDHQIAFIESHRDEVAAARAEIDRFNNG